MRLPELTVPLFALIVTCPVAAQNEPKSQSELVALRDKKLAAPFLRHARWEVDLSLAKKRAKKEGKVIVAYFTRSFAPSPPCELLEKGPFADPRFPKLGEQVVLYCHISSMVDRDADQQLPGRLGGQDLPFIIAFDEAVRPVATYERSRTFDAFAKFIAEDVVSYSRLRAQAGKGVKSAKAAFLLRRIRLGHLQPTEIQKILQSADYLNQKQRKVIEQGLAGLEIMEILARIDRKDEASYRRAAERVVAMKKAGRIPSGRQAPVFWQVILGHADKTADPKLFEEALRNIEQLPGPKRPERWTQRMQLRLRAMKYMKRREPPKPSGGKGSGKRG